MSGDRAAGALRIHKSFVDNALGYSKLDRAFQCRALSVSLKEWYAVCNNLVSWHFVTSPIG